MSHDYTDFPRDLRGLCSARVQNADGTCTELIDPVLAYFALWENRKGMEQAIEEPENNDEDRAVLREELELLSKMIVDLKLRILSNPPVFPPTLKPDGSPLSSVDHGAKSKIEKSLEDVEAGTFNPRLRSVALKGVRKVIFTPNLEETQPSHKEMKEKWKCSAQQAMDVWAWLKDHAGPEQPAESELKKEWLCSQPKEETLGRPKKKLKKEENSDQFRQTE